MVALMGSREIYLFLKIKQRKQVQGRKHHGTKEPSREAAMHRQIGLQDSKRNKQNNKVELVGRHSKHKERKHE
jgi:hypothetical protein